MIKKISQLIYLIIFISFQTCLASLPANLISDDEKVVRGSLKNGMDYIIYPHSSPKGQVNFWLQIHSGSLQEEEDQRGIAHFVEHMLFNGTRDYPNNSVIEEFEKLGLKFGRDVNAYTNYSETVYQFNMPSDNQQNISKVMNIFYNWASQATFDPKEVDDERGVIVEEWRANQGLKWRNSMQRYPFTLTDSRHLIREPIGLMDTINHVSPQRIKDYYEKWYQPQNMTFIVVGDIDVKYAKTIIENTFSSLMNKNIVNNESYKTLNYQMPAINKARYNVISDDENTVNSFAIIYRYPRIFAKNEQTFIEQTTYSLLTQLFNQRFHDLIQEGKLTDAQSGVSMVSQLGDDYQASYFRIVAKKDDLKGAINSLMLELERIDRFGFTQPELERLKKTQLSYLKNAAENPESRDAKMLISRIDNASLYNLPIISPKDKYRLTLKAYEELDLTKINQAWLTLRHGEDKIYEQIVTKQMEAKALTPEQLVQLSDQVKQTELKAYQQNLQEKPLMNTFPATGKVTLRENLKDNATMLTLNNGAKVIVYPTTFDDSNISVMAIGQRGALSFSDNDYNAVQFANKVVNNSGLGDLSASELKSWMAQNLANINTILQDHQTIISLTGNNKNIEPIFQLIYQRFNATKVNQEIWKVIKQSQENEIKALEIQPRSQYDQAVYQLRYQDSRALPISQQQLDAIDNNQFLKLDQQLFSDPSQFTFIIVGNINLDEISNLSEKYLASLINKDFSLPPSRELNRLNSQQNIIIEGEKEPYTRVINFRYKPLSRSYDEKTKQQLAAFNFVLSRDLRVEIREKQSGVYSIGSITSINPYVNEFVYRFNFSCDPSRYNELIELSKNIIDKRIEKGITREELAEYKKIQLRTAKLQKSSNAQIARLLANSLSIYQNMSLFDNIESYIEDLTVESINQTVKHFFNGGLIESTAILKPNDISQQSEK